MATGLRPFSATVTMLSRQVVTVSKRSVDFSIPPSLSFFRPSIDVTNHTNTNETLTLLLEISLDNGLTWTITRSISRQGGDNATEAGFEMDLPDVGSTQRRARCTLSLAGGNGAITTAINVQVG